MTTDDEPAEAAIGEAVPATGGVADPAALRRIVEAALLAAGRPLSIADLERLFGDGADVPTRDAIRRALSELDREWRERSLALQEVASGYRAQVRAEFEPWIARLWEERPPRYSRALLETLAIIAYRQPVTRSEIEGIRGVSVSTQIVRTLTERDWVRVVGHRETPGRPALYGTTRAFLDHFNLKSLDQLPAISDLQDLEGQDPELGFDAEGGTVITVQPSPGEGGEAQERGADDRPRPDAGAGDRPPGGPPSDGASRDPEASNGNDEKPSCTPAS